MSIQYKFLGLAAASGDTVVNKQTFREPCLSSSLGKRIPQVAVCISYISADRIQGIQLPDDEDQNSSRSIGLSAILPPDVDASQRKFCMNSLAIKCLDYIMSWGPQGIITFCTCQWNELN